MNIQEKQRNGETLVDATEKGDRQILPGLSNSQCIFIVEDDDAVRESLQLMLETHDYRVQTFASGQTFMSAFHADMRGCIVLDIRMPGMDGMAVQDALIERHCVMPIIFVTGHGDVELAVEAMKKGALDFIQKPYDEDELLLKINKALQLEQENVEQLVEKHEILGRLETLTPREREIMEKMIEGHANKVIAIDLDISQRTVEIHRSRVMHKMGTHSLAHLVKMVMAVS